MISDRTRNTSRVCLDASMASLAQLKHNTNHVAIGILLVQLLFDHYNIISLLFKIFKLNYLNLQQFTLVNFGLR